MNNKDIAKAIWEQKLEWYLKYLSYRGSVADVVRALNRSNMGCKFDRSEVDQYLATNAEDRKEPLAGMGIMLLEAMAYVIYNKKGSDKCTS